MKTRFTLSVLLSSLTLFACADNPISSMDGGTTADTADIIEVSLPDIIEFDTAIGSDDIEVSVDIEEVLAGGFGAPCQGNVDCLQGFCVEGEDGFFCTRSCDEECPEGFDCRSVQTAGSDPAFLCLPRLKKVCIPCKADYQCTGGACLDIGGDLQCAYTCATEADCPTGYGCLADASGEREGLFCQPKSGSCSCTPEVEGSIRSCVRGSEFGLCYGIETCDGESGWTGCTALVPSEDLCDGRDNDCDALVDDGVLDRACEVTVEGVGTCNGVEICLGAQGFRCTAATPEAESCDFRDNDCDGRIDEGFTDADGAYTTTAHCGSCNNDCTAKFPHGTGRCEAAEGASPICVVESCEPDYVMVGRFQCALPPDASCQPCREDGDCYGGSCMVLDGQDVCVAPCQADDECGDGYACQDLGSGPRCIPETLSCVCNAETVGQIRSCENRNDAGSCFGVETCGVSGWSGCSAVTAAEEICNGKDDDCDGVADDGIPNQRPCANTVAGVGSCAGVEVCMGALGYSCLAPTPSLETCDFQDNDCDGSTDENFRGPGGLFDQTAHCGTCNYDCSDKIEHGEGRCEAVPGASPVCVVDTCDTDYVAINRFQCALPPDVSCQPCTGDGDCLGGSCVALDGQRVCVAACGAGTRACQDGYRCEPLETTAGRVDRCVPITDSCVCSSRTENQSRTCRVSNAAGTCFGQETCDGDSGWTSCDARMPVIEVCDGLDNDCNGRADDGVSAPGAACQNSVAGVGTCNGTWYCQDSDGAGPAGIGWTCSAPTPQVETCDFLDNDCDGVADDHFKNAAGIYISNDHCGTCGMSCNGAIPNATAACVVAGGRARCEVFQCAPGYYRAGPTTCVPVTEDLCMPCVTDANCPTPGDKCLDLDGGKFCGRDCAAGNLHGTAAGVCPAGYACESVGSARQCVPESGSCSCLGPDDGRSRTCVLSNGSGTCYGQEVCDAELGWSVCSARTPGSESCNGVDDDCNAVVDDVVGRGSACQISNGFGTCSGVKNCSASALVCEAKTPAAERCNYADDDCDGSTDEGFSNLFGTCSKGQGICERYGFVACKADGSGTECNAVPAAAQSETCDGLDNDCDGLTDEGPAFADKGKTCFDGLGVCQVAGVNVCNAAGTGLVCSATKLPSSSELCDGLDNDCDGQTDENFPEKNQLCEDGLGVCKRFGTQVCAGNGASLQCSASRGPSSPETCDLVDNDCDGIVDDGFVTGGRYIGETACGNCFTNCAVIFDKPNAGGQCDAAPATPVCKMVCDAGFFDLNGVPEDGCEFRLDPTVIYVSESEAAARDDASCGLGPSTTGGGRYPCKSITRGLARATAASRTQVFVAGGAYYENITLVSGISVYGGYNPINWTRNYEVNLTAIFGIQVSGHRKTVVADGITLATTVFDGFSVYGQLASGVADNSYAIWIKGSNQKLVISNNIIWGGMGGPGANGSRGADGSSGGHGSAGLRARETSPGAACSAGCSGSNAGGAGGANASCAATAGGAGGTAPCPDWNETVDLCSSSLAGILQTSHPKGANGLGAGAGLGGLGGCDQLIDPDITSCSCNVPGVSLACPLGAYSSEGGNGSDGVSGNAGLRSATSSGQVAGGEWSGFGGSGGAAGGHGAGGGGGGAGGGVESYAAIGLSCANSLYSDFGGSGGGGGAGGCGGTGGTGGGAGGGAFGIFVHFAAAPGGNVPVISGNEIHLGTGGAGGRGGDGGTAGNGGRGGLGGQGAPEGTAWCAMPGSQGGEGGDGGPGGGGAGGTGGVAYGLFASGGSAAVWASDNLYFTDGAGGAGGAGGGTGAGGNAGQSGLDGASGARNF